VSWARIAPPEIDWGLTGCSTRHCVELAAVTLDGWPFCLDCADAEVDRWVAWSLNPELVELLPSLADR
jgi:hypothetical protein